MSKTSEMDEPESITRITVDTRETAKRFMYNTCTFSMDIPPNIHSKSTIAHTFVLEKAISHESNWINVGENIYSLVYVPVCGCNYQFKPAKRKRIAWKKAQSQYVWHRNDIKIIYSRIDNAKEKKNKWIFIICKFDHTLCTAICLRSSLLNTTKLANSQPTHGILCGSADRRMRHVESTDSIRTSYHGSIMLNRMSNR